MDRIHPPSPSTPQSPGPSLTVHGLVNKSKQEICYTGTGYDERHRTAREHRLFVCLNDSEPLEATATHIL